MKAKTIAIIYATKGGMGDVGKFAMTFAQSESSLPYNIRPIALSVEYSSEGTDKGLEVDVEDLELKEKIDKILGTMEDDIIKIDIMKDSAEKEIGNALEGTDAVISCLGNRQPQMERWCSLGTKKVIGAMKAKNINRLVSLSSMGIGKDFLKISLRTVIWRGLLRTFLRSVHKDLTAMEKEVLESDLDFVLVRHVGLSPPQSPKGLCDQLLSKEDGSLEFMLSKSDAAAFMLREALEPTVHSRKVTIGYLTSRSTTS